MPGMPRARSIPVILGALVLIPLGIVGARVARRIIVEPVTQAMPESLVRAVKDVVGGEAGCASNHPKAQAFLEQSNVVARPGARQVEHLAIDSGAERRSGPGLGQYQATTAPVFENGVCQGVRFADVAPDSVYAHLGIRNDDLIRRVDGREIDTPEQALEIYSKLLQQRRVEVELERYGRPTLNVYKAD
jgi:hypothetical protein